MIQGLCYIFSIYLYYVLVLLIISFSFGLTLLKKVIESKNKLLKWGAYLTLANNLFMLLFVSFGIFYFSQKTLFCYGVVLGIVPIFISSSIASSISFISIFMSDEKKLSAIIFVYSLVFFIISLPIIATLVSLN